MKLTRGRAIGLALGAAILAATVSHGQEHVRLVPQLGTAVIGSAALSPDGRFVLTAGLDKTVLLWDANTGEQIRALEGHTAEVESVAFSPDSRLALTGSADKTARLWDAETGKQIRIFKGHTEGVISVAFSPDGRSALTGSDDNTARLWNTKTGDEIRAFEGHEHRVNSVAFSPDGRYVLTGSDDQTARLWDTATGAQIRSFRNQLFGIKSVAFSPNGRLVVTGGEDNVVQLWDSTTGLRTNAFRVATGQLSTLAFSPDGRFVLTGSGDDSAKEYMAQFWDVATGQPTTSLKGSTGQITALSFSADGHLILTGSFDGTARLWDLTTGGLIRTLRGHTSPVWSAAFSPDGNYVLTASGSELRPENISQLWDAASGQQIRSFAGAAFVAKSVVFSSDGRSVLTGSDDNIARLWDVATGRQIRSFEPWSVALYEPSVALSSDGRYVLTNGGDEARLWDAKTSQKIQTFNERDEPISALGFSPDGHAVFTASKTTGVLWDVTTGQQIRTFTGHTAEITSVAFSRDGRWVLTGSVDNTARLWDLSTGRQTRIFTGHTAAITCVAFSRDGRYVLSGSYDDTARLWDTATGQQIRSFEKHTGRVNSVGFSPNGRLVLTASDDTTTRLWDVASGRELAELLIFENGGWAVTDPAGRYDSNDPDRTPGLVWVTDNNRVIELGELKDNYYTPNLLASVMKGERLPEVQGLELVPAPPDLTIIAADQAGGERIVVSIADQGGGVGKLVTSVNDRKVMVLEHPLATNVVRKTGKTEVTVDLSAATVKPGANNVTVYAYDADNQIRSHAVSTTFMVPARTKGLKAEPDDAMSTDYQPQFYGIVVGTASFAGNHAMNLMYPAHDAESMMKGLEIGADNLLGAGNVHLRLLTTAAKDERDQPTKNNIVAAFADVMKKAKSTDVLVVYFSGHGVSLHGEKDSYYYMTADARSLELENNPKLKQLSTVSGAELRQWLGTKGMPLKEVLILDTCAAGAASEELLKLAEKRDVPSDQRRAVEFLKDEAGTIILMGSAADKVSYEASKYGQGLLTYALLDGMRGRSVDASSQLNVSRWFQNASEEVQVFAQSIGGIQKPVIAAPTGTGFTVAVLSTADEAKIPIQAIKPELLHLTCHNGDDEDPLGLATAIRARLREISQPSMRGERAEPPIVYLDDLNEGPVDSLTPKIVYDVSGNNTSLRLRIDRAGKIVKEERLNVSDSDKNDLARTAAAMLVEMAVQVPPGDAKQ